MCPPRIWIGQVSSAVPVATLPQEPSPLLPFWGPDLSGPSHSGGHSPLGTVGTEGQCFSTQGI